MAKHFEDGGCGVRPFLDLWILNHRVDVVRSSREALLREGNLLKFAEACEALSEAWFGSDGHNELTLKMQDYLINSGVYGKLENQVAINSAKAGGGIGYILSRIWPSYEKLTITYPGLKGRKILIPLYQVRRWFRIVFSGGLKKMRTEVSVSSRQSDDEAEKIVEFFNELGLH